MRKNIILGIFICFMSVFLMSHNVFALSVSQSVDIIQTRNQPQVSLYNGSTWTNYQRGVISFTSSSQNFTLMRLAKSDFTSIDQFTLGDYIIIKGSVSVNKVEFNNKLYTVGGYIGSISDNVNCSIIDLDFGAVQDYSTDDDSWTRADFQLTCRILTTAQYLTINFRLNQDLVSSVSGLDTRLNISFDSATIATPSNTTEKEENTANENIEQNEQDSNSSSSDAEGASQSLISAIGGFVSSITSASPSNCNIDGDMGKFDLGNIDLCANPVPTYIQVISSFILIGLCIPFAIIMFNRFIALFRSFQT